MVIALAVLFSLMPFQPVHGDTMEEYLNNLVGPKKQYNTEFSPVYLKNNTTEESISPASGSLLLAQTDYYLPGKNGLDLEIKRIYESGKANVQEMKVKYVNGAWVDYIYSDEATSSFYEDRYNLGIGMRFSFPMIEIKKNEDGTSYKYLHTESGDTYRLTNVNVFMDLSPIVETDSTVDSSTRILKQVITGELDEKKVYYIEGQTVIDAIVIENNEFSNGQPDGTSKYKMVDKAGKRTYFAEDGRLLGIVDRYGNTIKFEYAAQKYTVNRIAREKKLISKITDTVGRVVTLSYNEDYTFRVKPVNAAAYSQEESWKESQNPNTTYSGDLEGKFQVVVNLPDGNKLKYDKSAVLVSNSTQQVIRTRLQRVYDVDSLVKYHYWYEQPELGFTYSNGKTYSAFNRYENITQINYFKENRLVKYTYNTYTKGLSDKGSMQYRKVFEKQELEKTGYEAAKQSFPDRYTGNILNKISYTYTNAPDGYGFEGYKDYDHDYLKDTYRFYSERTDMRGAKVKYTYNGLYELVGQEEYGNDHKEVIVTEHDEMKLPKKTERLVYNVVNGQSAGEPVKKIENFRYDAFGNLTNYTGPSAPRDTDGYPLDSGQTVVYSYDINRFHVPALKTWKKDSGTNCQITYTVDDKGNIIQEKRLHVEDGDKSLIIDYLYDSFGNMTKKTVNSPDNTYTNYYEYGVDSDGADHKGAYLTREYNILNGTEISKYYLYNFLTGDVKAEIDRNGNRTGYEYDIFHRIIKTTNPDGGTWLYKYNDTWNENRQREVTDPNQVKYSFSYDIFGAQVESRVFNNEQWHLLSRTEYDSNGNKIKDIDANGNSIRYAYNSRNYLIKKSYWEKDTAEKENMLLKYEVGTDPDTFRLVTVTDEDGYKSRMHYDVLDRLVATDITPDNTTYYTSKNAFDYEGNRISSTDSNNNMTEFIYDDLNRLVRQVDPLGNETIYSYNNIDKPIRKEEPGNKVTEYIYDLLGRLVTEKTYEKGSADYTYKSYSYDNAGNITGSKAGAFAGGADRPASETTYTYNEMNRATDEYKKLEGNKKNHTNFQYDKNGNKLQETGFIDQAETGYIRKNYEYDYLGRLTAEEGFIQEQGEVRRGYYNTGNGYDPAGNLIRKEAFNGTGYDITEYSYDYRNRMTKKTEPYKEGGISKTTSYSYDGRGLLIGETLYRKGEACTKKSEYDGMGNLIRLTDELGNTSRFVYDGEKNRIREIDPRYYTAAAEDKNPDIINTAPCIETEYDALNRPVRSTARNNNASFVIAYREYDGRGNITKQVDGEGYNSGNPSASAGEKYEYDVLNRVTGYISAETAQYNLENSDSKYTKKYTYDGAGDLLTEEDAYGNVTRNRYYMNGLLKEKEYPDGLREAYTYDLTGKVRLEFTDRAGNTTRKYMNVFGSPYRQEYPDGTTELFEYNSFGQVTRSIDRNGSSRYFEYDPARNITAIKEYISSDADYNLYRAVRSTYDEAGNILSRETYAYKEPLKPGLSEDYRTAGDKTVYEYDRASKLIKVIGPDGRETKNKYDARGNLSLAEAKTAEGKYDVKRYSYDLLSRLTEEITLVESSAIEASYLAKAKYDKDYSGRVWSAVSFDYYSNGALKSRTDPMGNTIRYAYDLDKRLEYKTDALENRTAYIYDLRGNLIEERDARNTATTYDYDGLNRLIRKHTPASDGGRLTTRYIYDASGNLIKQINPNEYQAAKDTEELDDTMKGMSYEYDKMNRLVAAYNPEGEVLRHIKYDSNGNIVKDVDGLRYTGDIDTSPGTIYEYDGLNRPVKNINAAGYSVAYEYDILDNLTKTTDARNNTTVFEYNSDRTLAEVTFADSSKMQYEYDRLGRMTKQTDQNGNTTVFGYNSLGKQASIEDAYGNVQEFKYDLAGNVAAYKDQDGNITRFKYDGNSRLAEKRIPIEEIGGGNYHYYIEMYSYDETGNILSQTVTGTKEPLSRRITNYSYYPDGLLRETVQSSGSNIKYHYDSNGNLTVTESLRENDVYDIAKYQYDTENRLIRSVQLVDEDSILTEEIDNISDLRDGEYGDRLSIITGFEYDLLGNRTKVISPRAYGLPESDGEGRAEYTETYRYDILNRLESIDRKYNGSSVSAEYSYDEAGNKIREINEKGDEIAYTYDSMNRLKTVTDAMNYTYEYRYDPAGNKTGETNPKGDTMSYTYDRLNRVVEVIDPYNKVISSKVYDRRGNIVKDIDAKGYLSADTDEGRYGIEYEYDLAGRAAKVTGPEGGATRYEYSQYGELIKNTDPLGNATQYEYDSAGRLTKVTDALGTATKYTYDKAGNKLTMTDGRGKTTRYGYGSFGLLMSYTDADGQETEYKYNLSLNTAGMKDRNGNETRYGYDNRGLLTEKKVAETGDTVAYTYDVLGSRETMTDATGTSTYEYNGNNWLLSIEKDGEPQISYDYDEIGNIITITDKQGNTTEYTYDRSSRMETVSFEGRTTTYEYDENGNRESISYDGEVEETYSYDKNNRMLELVNKKAGGSKISGYSYTYDKAGRQTSKTDSYGKTEYTYDKAGRIQKVEAPGKTTVYTYDGAGNRISQDETYTSEQVIPAIDGTGVGEIKYIVKRSEYVYSDTNRLLKLVEKLKDSAGKELMQKTTSFRYDSNGNEDRRSVEYITLYSKENPKAYEAAVYGEDTTEPIHAVVEQTASQYDGFNRLVRTEIIKATVKTVVEYAYDGDGLRTEKTVRRSDKGNTAEVTSYLYDRQHVILETRGNDEIRYVRGINYIARIADGGKLSYYLYNGHGDVVQTVSEDGEIENQYDYDIFGNPTLTVESYVNSIRYAGEYYDAETGLYYLRARYYDPYIGRFISEDSYWGEDTNPLSLNLYTYAHNDPIRYIDPSGHSILGVIGGIIGGLIGGPTGAAVGAATGEAVNTIIDDSRDRDKDRDKDRDRDRSRDRERDRERDKNREIRDAMRKFEQLAAKMMAQAQVDAYLTGNENQQSFINMINAQKSAYRSAEDAGNMAEAELYHQRAEILRERLYEMEARNGRDISDIVDARGNDAGKWESYELGIMMENVMKDGIVDSREEVLLENKEQDLARAIVTGKNAILYDEKEPKKILLAYNGPIGNLFMGDDDRDDKVEKEIKKIGYFFAGYVDYVFEFKEQIDFFDGKVDFVKAAKEGYALAKSAWELGKGLKEGEITGEDLKELFKEKATEAMIGGILHVKDNYYIMEPGYTTTKGEAYDLGYNSGRAIVELATIGMTARELTIATRNLAIKLGRIKSVSVEGATKAVNVNADVRKFSEYIFKDGAAPGKDVVYKNMGYGMNDSQALTNMYKEQAALKYAKGEYTLGKADSFGQRINIEIELPGIGDAAGKTSYLKSGWMIKPDGSLSLNTPFSGFTK